MDETGRRNCAVLAGRHQGRVRPISGGAGISRGGEARAGRGQRAQLAYAAASRRALLADPHTRVCCPAAARSSRHAPACSASRFREDRAAGTFMVSVKKLLLSVGSAISHGAQRGRRPPAAAPSPPAAAHGAAGVQPARGRPPDASPGPVTPLGRSAPLTYRDLSEPSGRAGEPAIAGACRRCRLRGPSLVRLLIPSSPPPPLPSPPPAPASVFPSPINRCRWTSRPAWPGPGRWVPAPGPASAPPPAAPSSRRRAGTRVSPPFGPSRPTVPIVSAAAGEAVLGVFGRFPARIGTAWARPPNRSGRPPDRGCRRGGGRASYI